MTSIDQHPITIRDRRAQDLPIIVDLARESISWHAETFGDVRPAPDRAALAHEYGQVVDSPELYFRVAELEDTVVGFLSASINPPRKGGIEALDEPSIYIGDIIVTKAARRRGVAAALFADLDSWAKSRGCRTIRLTMHAGNAPAQQLYERLGYRQTWITYRKDAEH